jgi:hypothetical protein
MKKKQCRRCNDLCAPALFRAGKNTCKACEADQRSERRRGIGARLIGGHRGYSTKAQLEEKLGEIKGRIGSDYDALKPEDFDVGSLNDGQTDPKATQDKRQEYSRRMGQYAEGLANGELAPEMGAYAAQLAEQERRFQNRRTARSVSLLAAHEALSLRLFRQAATDYLRDKITPTGYASKPKNRTIKRSVVVCLSDLHLGADLSELDNPTPFRAVQEARRLEHVIRQAIEFKPQYRAHSECVLLINGDIIEGNLGHDLRDGSPLTEQKVIFWKHFQAIIGVLAQTFPSVRVFCQPGNHGRDKLRHPGRATSSKWDGHEWQMYFALSQMASGLPNVKFDIPFRAVSFLDLHGSSVLMTHGDTELPLKHPDRGARDNAAAIDRASMTRVFGQEFSAAVFGHFHTPRYHPGNIKVIWNGALVPPNGHARTSGYIGEPCGQWIWEAVEGYPVGDLRFVQVDESTDRDERLGTIIKPFRFEHLK